MNECDPTPHERLIGVPRLCDECWHPIPWGQVPWRLVAQVPEPTWICLCTGCLPANERSAA